MNYGRNVIGATGIPIEVAASGPPEWMPGGVTIDWTNTVTAVGSDTVTSPAEQLTVKAGQKYLRYGQVITRITNQSTYTVTISGTPTGGSYTLGGNRPDTGAFVVSGAIAYNATGAQFVTAMNNEPSGPGFSGVPLTASLSGAVYTVTTPIQNLQVMSNNLTGGTSPNVVVAVGTSVSNAGMWGPFDPSATDGRQTLAVGSVGILNATTLQTGIVTGIAEMATDHPGTIVGGAVWQNRIIATSGSHSLAAGPTWTELLAVMPRLVLVGTGPQY